MTTKFSATEIASLKASADLVGLVREHVELKREGPEWKGRCPFHNENTPSFYVVPKKRMFHCFGCGANGDVFEWLKKTEGLDFAAAIQRLGGVATAAGGGPRFVSASAAEAQVKNDADNIRKKIEKARKLWKESVPASGTLVERYLNTRGLAGVMIPATIRFHPQLWNAETSTLMPGMVAVVTDMRQQIVGIHRTFLRSDGSAKANVRDKKKMLGACQGSHIWLGLPMQGILAVAEGIETALTIMKAKPSLGVWAAMSLGNMSAPVPQNLKELILCADADNKDMKAANAIMESAVRKHRASSPGCTVRIAQPDPGKDFNDMQRGAA